jgi:Icc-related predicted phosphoesterase
MPSFRVLSDLHFEFMNDHGRRFVEALPNEDVDALIVAGDLATCACLAEALGYLCDRFPEVVYIHGNHEFYGASRAEVMEVTGRLESQRDNLHFLDKEFVTIAGVRIVGAPLWFPEDPTTTREMREGMTDFHAIRDFSRWVYIENERARKFFAETVREGDIVVSHHLPAPESIAPRWSRSQLNRFFLSDERDLIERARPELWVHGHTHDACDYRISGLPTRIVCNPYGYHNVDVCPDFDPKKTIEVNPRAL